MFRKILDWLKGGLIKIGLIKSLKDISDHKDIEINKEMFDKIEEWKALYKGHAKFHDITYHTIEGQKKRKMDTLGVPKVASSEMASLIYNEKCEISIDNEVVSKLIEDVFKNNKFNKKFQDFLEYSFAHGGMVIKPYVEDDKIMLSFVTADCFIPISWNNDTIYEAVFPNEFHKGKKKVTHLEWHLWENVEYIIKNEVYESDNDSELGTKTRLEKYFPNLEEITTIENIERPIFSYFKPNTANNIDTKSPLGISLYANATDTIKAIDTAFDSLHREFRLGKKRIIVPESMVKTVFDSEGRRHRYFDSSDETYESFNTGNMDDAQIHDINVELRVEEHVGAINALLNLFAMQTGFSSGTFTFDGQSMKTATEVISEQSKTFKTKQSHEVIIEAALQELVRSIVAIAEHYQEGFKAPEEYEVTVAFDDSIAQDSEAEANRQIKLVQAELQSRKRAIIELFDVTEKEAEEIIAEIQSEQRQSSPGLQQLQAEGVMFGDRE